MDPDPGGPKTYGSGSARLSKRKLISFFLVKNDGYRDVWKKYEDQQAAIVTEMMSVGSGYADLMVHLGDVISRLDVAVGLAVAALTAPTPFTRPQVKGNVS
jgi:hypothetical protein